ncbi:hypothetical protein Clacol_006554 [Clathrus columnatus]|uniref:Uncharacterized protein n=1 Tax=Clathrus columnatus TaxID=1419009 RepID=A0AAV5AHZ6_9AGAM|nr:hypothetical protein Clacol_006554 [Clathrus columnatus]
MADNLHRLAANHWNKPETSDCTIVIPKDALLNQDDPVNHPSKREDNDNVTPGANDYSRSKQPNVPIMLHQQYLSVQSTLIQSILDGTRGSSQNISSSQDNTGKLSYSKMLQQQGSHLSADTFLIHSSWSPRLLPSSRPNHPIIFLPVPDPVCFPHLIHYMYFGSFHHIEDCLQKGSLTWQGVVRNVEYLGMRVEIKAALGRYHRIWMKPSSTLTLEGNDGSEPGDDSEDEITP